MTSWYLKFIAILSLVQNQLSAQECITPNGVRSVCILLSECKPLNTYLQSQKPRTRVETQYINLLLCYTDDDDRLYVCCAENDRFLAELITPMAVTETRETTEPVVSRGSTKEESVLPLAGECGRGILTKRIVGGIEAEIGEFSWMALLEYEDNVSNERSFKCGGSLIHRRYVLTAAHCVVGPVLRSKRLVNIRLGEHNLNTTQDCEESTNGSRFCTDPIVNVGIQFILIHPNFTTASHTPMNDIALIQLVHDVESTNYIHPICFPPPDLISNAGTRLTVTGWGQTESDFRSAVKLKVELPVVDFDLCQSSLGQIELNRETQVCAGMEYQKDSCRGDSGGPLMLLQNGYWYIEGLVSFGLSPCGLPGAPGVYTRVNYYTNWILNTIQVQNLQTSFGVASQENEDDYEEDEDD